MTRKEYEAQQVFKRNQYYEASIKYQNQPHSFRGNLLRIRSVGGKCIIRQLPPVWKEIRHREEKAYLRRHADKK